MLIMFTSWNITKADEPENQETEKHRMNHPVDLDSIPAEERQHIENEALTFAESHHPELARLLKNLKKHDPAQYNKGILELRKTITRLDKIRTKYPEKYDREVHFWTLNSQIRLQVAMILVSGKQEDHDKLTALLVEKRQSEIRYLQQDLETLSSDYKKIEERKTKLEVDLASKQADIDAWVKAEKERLLKPSGSKSNDKSSSNNKSEGKTPQAKKTTTRQN